jgi:hypothetical protein
VLALASWIGHTGMAARSFGQNVAAAHSVVRRFRTAMPTLDRGRVRSYADAFRVARVKRFMLCISRIQVQVGQKRHHAGLINRCPQPTSPSQAPRPSS